MRFFWLGLTAALLIACLVLILRKKNKKTNIFVLSLIIIAMLGAQIVLGECISAKMLALESIQNIALFSAIINIIDIGKWVVVLILVGCVVVYYSDMKALEQEKTEKLAEQNSGSDEQTEEISQ